MQHIDHHTTSSGHLTALADGHHITTHGQAGSTTFDEVYLHPGLNADWDHAEDSWELHLSGDPELAKGRLFLDVPVEDVRTLIAEHGGTAK
ncbi:hypothetical protein [Streptomyces sp. AD55]|uniref:hypothetical protein n=1 Tax=Streptomyces sp. AD55 TaxID=3242895 RepID=UPI003527C145